MVKKIALESLVKVLDAYDVKYYDINKDDVEISVSSYSDWVVESIEFDVNDRVFLIYIDSDRDKYDVVKDICAELLWSAMYNNNAYDKWVDENGDEIENWRWAEYDDVLNITDEDNKIVITVEYRPDYND